MNLRASAGEMQGQCGESAMSQLPKSFKARSGADIFWIHNDFKFQLGLVGLGWGNEPMLEAMYSAAALIVTVPPADARPSIST